MATSPTEQRGQELQLALPGGRNVQNAPLRGDAVAAHEHAVAQVAEHGRTIGAPRPATVRAS